MWRLLIGAYQLYANGNADQIYPALPRLPMDGGREPIDNRYTIDAKANGPATVPMMLGPLMQTLLEDRFHLKVHRETREIPVYVMTVAKDGPKLQAAQEGACLHYDPTVFNQPGTPPGGKPWCAVPNGTKKGSLSVFDARGINLDLYATLIRLDRPVIDRTGLAGTFDIHVEWLPDEADRPDAGAASDPPGTALIAAIRRQLGLQLDAAKGPYEFLVIDRIERPSEN